jgi:FtsH-binding integral membrane protein
MQADMSENEINLLIEVIGWAGSIAILVAYGLNSYQKITSSSLTFTLLNLFGGLMLIGYTIYKDALPNTFVNLVWVIIAIIALAKNIQQRTSKKIQS